jgi:hypothetical protein
MNPILITILSITVLAGIAFQDFRLRAIHWGWLPLLALLFAWQTVTANSWDILWQGTLLNISFVGLQWLVITLYFSLKEGRFVNIIDHYLGLGDLLFFVALTVAFSPFNFIVFFIVGLLFSLLTYGTYMRIKPSADQHIPLAGLMALPLIVLQLLAPLNVVIGIHHQSLLTLMQ